MVMRDMFPCNFTEIKDRASKACKHQFRGRPSIDSNFRCVQFSNGSSVYAVVLKNPMMYGFTEKEI